jgi:hypothetical protein
VSKVVSVSDKAEARSRLLGIRLAMLTLRMRDNWIKLFGDHQTALIALAIVVIMSERLMRSELDPELETLSVPMPTADLAKCNLSSIAAATGLNRETTRRKVDQLVRRGLVIREAGVIRLKPGFTQQKLAGEVVKTQLDELRRALNDLLRIEALELRES